MDFKKNIKGIINELSHMYFGTKKILKVILFFALYFLFLSVITIIWVLVLSDKFRNQYPEIEDIVCLAIPFIPASITYNYLTKTFTNNNSK